MYIFFFLINCVIYTAQKVAISKKMQHLKSSFYILVATFTPQASKGIDWRADHKVLEQDPSFDKSSYIINVTYSDGEISLYKFSMWPEAINSFIVLAKIVPR